MEYIIGLAFLYGIGVIIFKILIPVVVGFFQFIGYLIGGIFYLIGQAFKYFFVGLWSIPKFIFLMFMFVLSMLGLMLKLFWTMIKTFFKPSLILIKFVYFFLSLTVRFIKKNRLVLFLLSIPLMQMTGLVQRPLLLISPWIFLLGFLMMTVSFLTTVPVKMK